MDNGEKAKNVRKGMIAYQGSLDGGQLGIHQTPRPIFSQKERPEGKYNSFLIRIWLDSLWNIKTFLKKLLILQRSFLNNYGRKREFGRFQIRYEIF